MNRARGKSILLGSILFIAMVALAAAPVLYVRAVLALFIAAVVLRIIFKQKAVCSKELSKALDSKEAEKNRQIIATLNHVRHDWMNDIQVLYGYISLKKFEALLPYVEKIRGKMFQESYISKLGIPSLVAYLFSYRTDSTVMELEVELEEELQLQLLPLRGEIVTEATREIVEAFKSHAQPSHGEANVLSLQFEAQDSGLLLDFVYRGHYKSSELTAELKRRLLEKGNVLIVEETVLGEGEAALTVRLPFHT